MGLIVVDVGSHAYGSEESVRKLIERFSPWLLFAFDPHPDAPEGIVVEKATPVVYRRSAAWLHGDGVEMVVNGTRTHVAYRAPGDRHVDSFDLGGFLLSLPEGVVLKLDCEGAEYPLLRDLHDRGIDLRLGRVLVEWHEGFDPAGPFYANGWAVGERPTLRCEVEPWT